MKLCEKIVLLRKKAGLSQEAMADKLGVSRIQMGGWFCPAGCLECAAIKQVVLGDSGLPSE